MVYVIGAHFNEPIRRGMMLLSTTEIAGRVVFYTQSLTGEIASAPLKIEKLKIEK